MTHADIREQCWLANRRLPTLGLVDLTWGNVSVASADKSVFAIKPSGVAYDALTPRDIVIVNREGKRVDGTLNPSSDTPTHAILLREFPKAFAVVHTHSRHATAWAQSGRSIPCLGTTHADHFRHAIPVTRPLTPEEVAENYEHNTGQLIVETFRTLDPADVPAVLVHGHGPFVWGNSVDHAVENAQVLEIIAQMARDTFALVPDAPPLDTFLSEKHFTRKHGPKATYGQRA
jgi:L-ribulose-5-phosphate 4-epimerase